MAAPNGKAGVVLGRASTTGTRPKTPRWVKVSWTVVLLVVVLFVIGLLTKGLHVPGQGHGMPADNLPVSVLAGGEPAAAVRG